MPLDPGRAQNWFPTKSVPAVLLKEIKGEGLMFGVLGWRFRVLRFRVQCLGFRVWGLGCGV